MSYSPTILETNDKPTFVVLPYDENIWLTSEKPRRTPADDSVPHKVRRIQAKNNWSLTHTWSEHQGITKTEMTTRLNTHQPSYVAIKSTELS